MAGSAAGANGAKAGRCAPMAMFEAAACCVVVGACATMARYAVIAMRVQHKVPAAHRSVSTTGSSASAGSARVQAVAARREALSPDCGSHTHKPYMHAHIPCKYSLGIIALDIITARMIWRRVSMSTPMDRF